jgi:hypothetical protein
MNKTSRLTATIFLMISTSAVSNNQNLHIKLEAINECQFHYVLTKEGTSASNKILRAKYKNLSDEFIIKNNIDPTTAGEIIDKSFMTVLNNKTKNYPILCN